MLSTLSASIIGCDPLWLRLEPRRKLAPFPSARNYGTMVCGKDKYGTKEKTRTCSDRQGHSDWRAVAPRRACGDRCLDRVVERQKTYSGTRHQAIGSARPEGQDKVSEATKENEVRRLLSKALSRRRRQADSPSVHDAMHMDLNRDFEERGGDGGLKYFVAVLMLEGLVYVAAIGSD